MERRVREIATVFLTVCLLVTTAAAGGRVAIAQEADGGGADEVFITDDGDAIMLFEGEGGDTEATGSYGIDIEQGIAHALISSPDVGDGSISGGMTAAFTDAAMSANGNLTAPKPDPLESLSLDIEAVSNQQESRFDATLSTELAEAGSLAMALERASTEGSVAMSADRFQLDGQFEVDSSMGLAGEDTSLSFALSEADGSYTIEVAQDRTVSEFAAEQWQTRDAAKATIEQQFGSIAIALGGQSTVSIDSYSFTEAGEGEYRLDIAYTATVNNVDERLEALVAQQLTRSGEVSQAQAEQLAADLRAVTINEAAVSFEAQDGTASGSVTLDVANYGDLLLSYFELAEELGVGETSLQNLDRARTTFEAQRAADVTNELDWSGSLTVSEGVTVDAELHQSVSNWQAFREELSARDVPLTASRVALSATTSGADMEMEGSAAYEGEAIVTRFVNQALNASDMPSESKAVLRGFKRADLQTAKLETSLDEELRLEAGATFGNMGVLRDALAEVDDLPAMDSLVGRTESGQVNSYMRVSGAVGGDATEADVRALPGVGDDTTVHLPGTWDREFPEMDTQTAEDFLDVDEDIGVDETASGSGPGFGAVAALVALLALALLGVRREG